MPPRGQLKALLPTLPPVRRELAQTVRALLRASGGSLRGVADQIHSSRSVLCRLAAGEFLFPDTETVLKLHEFAERKARVPVIAVGELQRLLQRVADENESAGTDTGSAEAAGPATGNAASTGTGAPAVLAGAPVPPTKGDRRTRQAADLYWPVDELAMHLDCGRYEHAVGMLDYAGDEAPAVESAAAIQACRSRGLAEAADTLLRKVAGRPERVVLAAVGHLMDVGNHADARALISCSTCAA